MAVQEPAGFEQLDPMIAAAERELETAGVEESPGVVLADAGYWSKCDPSDIGPKRGAERCHG